MGLFDFFKKKEAPVAELLPDLARQAILPEYATILREYETRRQSERFGLCLVGGGSKGRWQAGFLARAAEIGLLKYVDVVAGTSVGGLNANIFARYIDQSHDLQEMVNVWRSIRVNTDVYLGEIPDGIASGLKALPKLNGPSLLDTAPLHSVVKKHLEGYSSFRIPVYSMTTDYIEKKRVVLGPEVSAVDRALATSAVPVMFPAYKGRFMDGGCVDNIPAVFLIEEQKCSKVMILYCDPDESKMPKTASTPTTIGTGAAALAALFSVQEEFIHNVVMNTLEMRKLKGLDPIEVDPYWPSIPSGDMLNFESNHNLLQAGYDDASKYLSPEKVRALLAA